MVHENAGFSIGQYRARFPAIPKRIHRGHVFIGHVIAQIMFRHARQAVIHGGEITAAGDHVPADTPGGNLIQAGHQTREEIGRIGEGGKRGHNSDPAGGGGHQRCDHAWVLARHGKPVAQVNFSRATEAFADVAAVFNQQIIEAGAFQGARHVTKQFRHAPITPYGASPGFAPRLGG